MKSFMTAHDVSSTRKKNPRNKALKIEKSHGTIYIDLEVHPEKDYEFVEDMPGYKGSR